MSQDKNVVLFYGDEEYIKKEKVREWVRKHVPEESQMMNVDRFDDKTFGMDAFFYAAETLPFLCDYRIIILRDTGLFALGRKEEAAEMEKYLPNLPASTIVIFSESQVDKRSKLFKMVGKQAVECAPLSEKELKQWVTQQARVKGKEIGSEEAIFFIRTVGMGMDVVSRELDKLMDYKGVQPLITEADIETVCTKSLEAKVFDLTKAIGNKSLVTAIDIYNQLLLMKESPFGILALMYRQFKNILLVKDLQKKNYPVGEMASLMGIPGFGVSECLRQSKHFTSKVLYEAMCQCQETDVAIKQGRIADKPGVELLIIKYSSNE